MMEQNDPSGIDWAALAERLVAFEGFRIGMSEVEAAAVLLRFLQEHQAELSSQTGRGAGDEARAIAGPEPWHAVILTTDRLDATTRAAWLTPRTVAPPVQPMQSEILAASRAVDLERRCWAAALILPPRALDGGYHYSGWEREIQKDVWEALQTHRADRSHVMTLRDLNEGWHLPILNADADALPKKWIPFDAAWPAAVNAAVEGLARLHTLLASAELERLASRSPGDPQPYTRGSFPEDPRICRHWHEITISVARFYAEAMGQGRLRVLAANLQSIPSLLQECLKQSWPQHTRLVANFIRDLFPKSDDARSLGEAFQQRIFGPASASKKWQALKRDLSDHVAVFEPLDRAVEAVETKYWRMQYTAGLEARESELRELEQRATLQMAEDFLRQNVVHGVADPGFIPVERAGAQRLAGDQARRDADIAVDDWLGLTAGGRVISMEFDEWADTGSHGAGLLSVTFTTAAVLEAGLMLHETVWQPVEGATPSAFRRFRFEVLPWKSMVRVEQSARELIVHVSHGDRITLDITGALRQHLSSADVDIEAAGPIASTINVFANEVRRRLVSA